MYTVLDMEERGVHIDYYPLERDTCKWEKDRDECTKIVFKHLGELNLNSGKQLSTALLERGYAKEDGWPRTEPSKNFPNGQLQTTAHALQKVVTHKKLLAALLRRSKLEHMMNNFAYPWLDRMEGYGRARLWPEFNQVRGRDERDRGTRSGRFSSANPNFQQLNREPDDLTLPFMRRYLLPEPGHLLLGRDFNQQELRILAHFEGNLLKDLYLEDPKLDIHDLIKGFMVASTGEDIDRAHIKRLNFGTIYGMGADKFAWMEGIEDLSYARYLHRLHKNKFPGLRDINKSLRELSDNGDPIATRMGRLYFPTPGKEYVQLNRLIQGSAADHMKFVLPLVADAVAPYGAYILLTVHDEILVSCPKEHVKPCMRDFRISMETPFFDIPIPTDGKIGRNWGAMRKCLH